MKKLFVYSVATLMLFASCGNNKKAETAAAEAQKSFEQEQIEAGIKVQVDSLAASFARMQQMPFMVSLKNGELLLTEEEKLAKPQYLVDPIAVEELITLSQKYRAVAILTVDKTIAKAYDINTDSYDAAITTLLADIDDPAFDVFTKENDMPFTEACRTFYDQEDKNGRINYFWETVTSLVAEELFTIAQHQNESFLKCLDDKAVSDLTLRIVLLQDGLERLSDYAPELAELCETIRPLEKLNAITVDEFKEQLASMSEEITGIRNSLLD